jgi:hypothetical protein
MEWNGCCSSSLVWRHVVSCGPQHAECGCTPSVCQFDFAFGHAIQQHFSASSELRPNRSIHGLKGDIPVCFLVCLTTCNQLESSCGAE